jgi:hypothetical protein
MPEEAPQDSGTRAHDRARCVLPAPPRTMPPALLSRPPGPRPGCPTSARPSALTKILNQNRPTAPALQLPRQSGQRA